MVNLRGYFFSFVNCRCRKFIPAAILFYMGRLAYSIIFQIVYPGPKGSNPKKSTSFIQRLRVKTDWFSWSFKIELVLLIFSVYQVLMHLSLSPS